jgi:hypothetical protein
MLVTALRLVTDYDIRQKSIAEKKREDIFSCSEQGRGDLATFSTKGWNILYRWSD